MPGGGQGACSPWLLWVGGAGPHRVPLWRKELAALAVPLSHGPSPCPPPLPCAVVSFWTRSVGDLRVSEALRDLEMGR